MTFLRIPLCKFLNCFISLIVFLVWSPIWIRVSIFMGENGTHFHIGSNTARSSTAWTKWCFHVTVAISCWGSEDLTKTLNKLWKQPYLNTVSMKNPRMRITGIIRLGRGRSLICVSVEKRWVKLFQRFCRH